MRKQILAAAFALAAVPLLAGCPDTADMYYEVVNVHAAWVEDGPGGTIPTKCPPGSGQWAVVIQKYQNQNSGGPRKLGSIETVCTDAASAKAVAPGDRWKK